MNLFELPWPKILATIFGISIAVVEVWNFKRKRKNVRWEKKKRPIIIVLSMFLLVITIWDSVEEKSEEITRFKLEQKRRNKQIIKDSLRATQIIVNLGEALQKINSTSKNLSGVDSLLNTVKNDFKVQVTTLNNVVFKSEELYKYQTGGDSYIKYFLLKYPQTNEIRLSYNKVGVYPVLAPRVNITMIGVKDEFRKDAIVVEEPLIGKGGREVFSVQLGDKILSGGVIATFKLDEFEKDITLWLTTDSYNGRTFQNITWKNHKENKNYKTIIQRVEPFDPKKKDNILDTTTGVGHIIFKIDF